MNFLFATTDHTSDRIWFRDEEDYIAAMNIVAVYSYSYGINLLAFVLMSNHLHLIMDATTQNCITFLTRIKQVYSFHYRKKYGRKTLLKRLELNILNIPENGDDIKRAIAYVTMNPVAANICYNPAQYQWGSGKYFFSPEKENGIPLAGLSARKRMKAIGSVLPVPLNWTLTPKGYIHPASFTNLKFVEGIFHTPKSFDYFLRTSRSSKFSQEPRTLPTFSDQVINAAIIDYRTSVFRKDKYAVLTDEEKEILVREIRRRFSGDVNQIARVVELSPEEVSRILS